MEGKKLWLKLEVTGNDPQLISSNVFIHIFFNGYTT